MATWLSASNKRKNIMTVKVIKFEADWCGPCKALTPVWNKIAGSTPGVDFEVVDIDKEPDMATAMSIRAVPTIVFLKNDTVVDSMVGLQKEDVIRKMIESLK